MFGMFASSFPAPRRHLRAAVMKTTEHCAPATL